MSWAACVDSWPYTHTHTDTLACTPLVPRAGRECVGGVGAGRALAPGPPTGLGGKWGAAPVPLLDVRKSAVTGHRGTVADTPPRASGASEDWAEWADQDAPQRARRPHWTCLPRSPPGAQRGKSSPRLPIQALVLPGAGQRSGALSSGPAHPSLSTASA